MRGTRWVRVVYAIGFFEGTGSHAYFLLTGGVHAYSYAPLPVQVLFHALLVIDPLTALLVLRSRPVGPPLAAAVMLADLAGNWWVAWPGVTAHPLGYLQPVGLLPITLFGVFVLVTARGLRRAFGSAQPDPPIRSRQRQRPQSAESQRSDRQHEEPQHRTATG